MRTPRIIYRDRYLDVVEVGGERYFASRAAVMVVAVDGDDLWLIEEPAPAAGEVVTVAAGGVIEPGETAVEAADHELREELGFEAARIVEVGVLRPWV